MSGAKRGDGFGETLENQPKRPTVIATSTARFTTTAVATTTTPTQPGGMWVIGAFTLLLVRRMVVAPPEQSKRTPPMVNAKLRIGSLSVEIEPQEALESTHAHGLPALRKGVAYADGSITMAHASAGRRAMSPPCDGDNRVQPRIPRIHPPCTAPGHPRSAVHRCRLLLASVTLPSLTG